MGETRFRGAARGGLLGRLTRSALAQLTMTRILETVREPGTMFWVFGFPILLSVALGLVFLQHRTPGCRRSWACSTVRAITSRRRRQSARRARELEATLQAAQSARSAPGAEEQRPSGCARERSRCW